MAMRQYFAAREDFVIRWHLNRIRWRTNYFQYWEEFDICALLSTFYFSWT